MAMRKGLPAKLAATDADDTRYDLSGLVVENADGTPRGGLFGPIRNIVSARANMAVDVALFKAVAVRDAGVVLLANDGTVQVTITAAPASNSRYTVIYAKQNDSSSTVTTPDANDTPVLETVDGTSAPSPTKPSIPVGAVEIATIQVPAGATATNSGGVVITQAAQYTAAAGGVVPFRTKATLDLWTTAPLGQEARVIADTVAAANNKRYYYNGTAWVTQGAFSVQNDVASVSIGTSGASWIVNVSFATGAFTVAPNVYLTLQTSPGIGRKLVTQAVAITTTGFQCVVATGDASNPGAQTAAVAWKAEQMTPTSASGVA